MMTRIRNLSRTAVAIVLGGLLLAGCSSPAARPDVDTSMANLLGIHSAYADFIAATRKAPRAWPDLEKAYAEDDRAALDQRFRSPHDNKPYVVIWGIMLGLKQSVPPAVLAHEQDGVGGKRWVLLTDASCRLMTQEEFDKARKAAR